MRVKVNGSYLKGTHTFRHVPDLFMINQYDHHICHPKTWDFSPYWAAWHTPLTIHMDLNFIAIHFYRAITRRPGLLDSVDFLFPEPFEDGGGLRIGLVVNIYPTKLESVRIAMKQVKNPRFEHYPHVLIVSFRYKFIRAYRPLKTLFSGTFLWNKFFAKGEISPKMTMREYEKILTETRGYAAIEREYLEKKRVVKKTDITLIKAAWEPGPEGFDFKKICFLRIEAQSERSMNRLPVIGDVWGVYKGEEENLNLQAECFLDTKGIGTGEVTLPYTSKYKKDLEDGTIAATQSCEYIVKNLHHPGGSNTIASPLLTVPAIRRRTVNILEFEDILFRHNSAVFLPESVDLNEQGSAEQEKLHGLSVVKAILLRAVKAPEQKMLIAGHTDASGPQNYNFALSRQRALALYHILVDEPDEWAAIADQRHVNEDMQQVLQWAAFSKGWDCNPGAIDGVIGEKTKRAIRHFQRSSGIGVDGVFGKQTWKAVFRLYQEYVTKLLESDDKGLKALQNRKSINWAYGLESRAVGCGELWPVDGTGGGVGQKSQKNRRVEALFFDESELPRCCCTKGYCTKAQCAIYPEGLFEKVYIAPDGRPLGDLRVTIQGKGEGIAVEISGPEKRVVFTDADGVATFFNLKIGEYTAQIADLSLDTE